MRPVRSLAILEPFAVYLCVLVVLAGAMLGLMYIVGFYIPSHL